MRGKLALISVVPWHSVSAVLRPHLAEHPDIQAPDLGPADHGGSLFDQDCADQNQEQ